MVWKRREQYLYLDVYMGEMKRKSLSIPRLEPMSARILSVLMKDCMNALSSQVKIDCTRHWLDSKTALYWNHNYGERKQFVQYRVNEILGLARKEEWAM